MNQIRQKKNSRTNYPVRPTWLKPRQIRRTNNVFVVHAQVFQEYSCPYTLRVIKMTKK